MKWNKKGGIWSEIPGIFKLLLGVGIVFLIASLFLGYIPGIDLIQTTSKHDYDGDGIPDAADECPCGSPAGRNLIDYFDGLRRCIQKFAPCENKYEEYGFLTETDQRGREVCIYTKQQCMEYIQNEVLD